MHHSITLALTLLLLLPVAAASHRTGQTMNEDHPDCERGQPGLGAEGFAFACEGEHWDGQDPTGSNVGCSGTDVSPGGSYALSHSQCADNGATTDASGRTHGSAERREVSDPLGVRLSLVTMDASAASYAALNVFAVGEVVLFAEGCAAGCVRLAGYYEDGTPFNMVWLLVNSLGITRPFVTDGDCDQDAYEHRYAYGVPCGRDNTAVTAEAWLP